MNSLRESEALFAGIFESAPDAIVVIDAQGRIMLINTQVESLFGYPPEELLGQPVERLIPERFRKAHVSYRLEYSAKPHLRPMGAGRELYGRRKDGTEFPVDVMLGPLQTPKGPVVLSIIRDITERKHFEQTLQESEERFRQIAAITGDWIWEQDPAGCYIYSNSAVKEILGYEPEEVLGKRYLDLFTPAQREEMAAALPDSANTQDRFLRLINRYRHKNGHEVITESTGEPLFDTQGRLIKWRGIDRDITARKYFEQTLQEKNIELENANLAKDRFLASMSHELRTPLNAIIGFTGTLLMKLPGPLTPDQEKQLRTIQASARHLLSLINDLLDLAKIESGKVELVFEPVECQEVVEEVATALRPLAEAKGLKFEVQAPKQGLRALTDRRALSQILINLTNNAIKFTEKGKVCIEPGQHQEKGRWLTEIRVSDTGIGIRPEDQVKLFQAFEQVDASNARRYEGTGLGLHLSQKLAALLGGYITFASEHGKGSTFTLIIPEK